MTIYFLADLTFVQHASCDPSIKCFSSRFGADYRLYFMGLLWIIYPFLSSF